MLLDLDTWDTLRQLMEDLEDMVEIEAARQEKEKTVAWADMVAEYQTKYAVEPDVQN